MTDTADSNLIAYGYHGTSATAAAIILQEGFQVRPSKYHWLGDGVYFFQDAPARALEWAIEHHPDDEPAVLRATISLEDDCMDLVDIQWFPLIRQEYISFISRLEKARLPLPKQNPQISKAHRLDCAFCNYLVESLAQNEGIKIRAIRAVFMEGESVAPSSAIFDRAHIQISVLDTLLIQECCLYKSEKFNHARS